MGCLLSLQCLLLLYSFTNGAYQQKNTGNVTNHQLVRNFPLFITNPTGTIGNKFQHSAFWNKPAAKKPCTFDVKIGDKSLKFGISLTRPKSIIRKSLVPSTLECDGYVTIDGSTKFLKIYPSDQVQDNFDGLLALDFVKTFNTLFIGPDGEIKFNLSVDPSKHIAIPLEENFTFNVKDSNDTTRVAGLNTSTNNFGRENITIDALKTTNDWIYLNAPKMGYKTTDIEYGDVIMLDTSKIATNGCYLDIENQVLYIGSDDEMFKPTSVEETAASIKIALESGKTTFKEVKQLLTTKGIPIYGCKTPDDIILLAAKLKVWGEKKLLEAVEDFFDTLPQDTPNYGVSTVSAYRSESQLLRRAVNANSSLLDSIIAELDLRGVDYKDCKSPESYADRLAYSRVFSNSKKKRGGKFRNNNGPVWNVTRRQIPGGMAQLFSNDGDFGIKFEFSDSQNSGDFGDMSGLFGDGIVENIIKQFMGESPFSMLQRKSFNPFTYDQQIPDQSDYEDNDTNYTTNGDSDESGESSEQMDTTLTGELQKLYDKAGNRDLQNLIEKANQDAELRSILEHASKHGFDSVQKSNISKTALYLLQKLRDAKLI